LPKSKNFGHGSEKRGTEASPVKTGFLAKSNFEGSN
jgi:hypothetical protein